MSFFRVIIPTFNGARHLRRMVDSIRSQTCQDYHLVIVDDMSEDETWDIVQELRPDKAVRMDHKGFQGGARNEGMKYCRDDLYTLFLDDDDQLMGNEIFEKIRKNAEENHLPDIIQLNYRKTIGGVLRDHKDRYQYEPTPRNICMSSPVAPWTKAVKTSLCVEFPEGLINGEDVLQHIRQCDVCETASILHEDCVNWIIRPDSASQNHENIHWKAAWFLEGYNLTMSLDTFRNDWAKARAERRIARIKQELRT